MERMYPVYKKTYGDFDIAQFEVVAVSPRIEGAREEAARLNAKRNKEDLRNEVEFVAEKKSVPVV